VLPIAIALIAFHTISQLFMALSMWRYRRKIHSQASPSYAPRVALIVPCWEAHPDLPDKMRALLEQDYADYRVIFVTGSTSDPAWPILDELVKQYPGTRLVTSGTPIGRSQKVHNALRALEEADDAEVYAFADSDADYPPDWLRRLVAPLALSGVGATTGWFWWDATGRSIWAKAMAWGSNTQVTPSFINEHLTCTSGASTAIRTTTFQEADIAKAWQHVVCDDTILTERVRGLGLRIQFVPRSLLTFPVLDDSLRWAFRWTKRQMIGVKVYTPRMYWLGLVMALPNLLMALSPLLLLASLLLPSLAAPALLLLAMLPVQMATGVLFCAIMGRWRTARYAYLDYLAIVIGLWGLITSIFSNRFTWGPLTYEIVSPQEARVLGSSGPGSDAPPE
jgi:cellulose synthase/poly-beta-1,6-N-acetylglucosamine synthase-like glycosyltransferase